SLKDEIKFESGKGIQAKKGALGMSLQTPRALTPEDSRLLRGGAAPPPRRRREARAELAVDRARCPRGAALGRALVPRLRGRAEASPRRRRRGARERLEGARSRQVRGGTHREARAQADEARVPPRPRRFVRDGLDRRREEAARGPAEVLAHGR